MFYTELISEELNIRYASLQDEITILSYDGDDHTVRVPDHIDGKPVTRIENYAYSGKQMYYLLIPETVTEICHHAFSECRNLKTITLPESVRKIGNYAFYNCWSVETVHLTSRIKSIGFGAFKNCEKLKEIIQDKEDGFPISIGSLLDDLSQQIHVTMRHIGADGSVQEAKVIFTEHDYDAGSFTAAWNKQYEFSAIGSGKYMRYCIGSEDIDYRKYDSMFYVLLREDAFSTVCTVAIERLMFPYQLGSEAKLQYLQYIREHAYDTALQMIRDDALDKLNFMITEQLLENEDTDRLIDMTTQMDKTEYTAALMDYRHSAFGSMEDMDFEL